MIIPRLKHNSMSISDIDINKKRFPIFCGFSLSLVISISGKDLIMYENPSSNVLIRVIWYQVYTVYVTLHQQGWDIQPSLVLESITDSRSCSLTVIQQHIDDTLYIYRNIFRLVPIFQNHTTDFFIYRRLAKNLDFRFLRSRIILPY